MANDLFTIVLTMCVTVGWNNQKTKAFDLYANTVWLYWHEIWSASCSSGASLGSLQPSSNCSSNNSQQVWNSAWHCRCCGWGLTCTVSSCLNSSIQHTMAEKFNQKINHNPWSPNNSSKCTQLHQICNNLKVRVQICKDDMYGSSLYSKVDTWRQSVTSEALIFLCLVNST